MNSEVKKTKVNKIDNVCQKEKSINNDNISDMLGFANFILTQVNAQQDVRDRWFGHYLVMLGGVLAFTTLTLGLLDGVFPKNILLGIACAAFLLVGLLGILFFILFLCQRSNYRHHYKTLKAMQSRLIQLTLPEFTEEELYSTNNKPFIMRKRGADYYTQLIQAILASASICSGLVLLMISLQVEHRIIILAAVLALVISILVLQIINSLFERKG
jgi:hypothetical protein